MTRFSSIDPAIRVLIHGVDPAITQLSIYLSICFTWIQALQYKKLFDVRKPIAEYVFKDRTVYLLLCADENFVMLSLKKHIRFRSHFPT